jgi:hypothetical protein
MTFAAASTIAPPAQFAGLIGEYIFEIATACAHCQRNLWALDVDRTQIAEIRYDCRQRALAFHFGHGQQDFAVYVAHFDVGVSNRSEPGK